jgi:twitching motility protein PilT
MVSESIRGVISQQLVPAIDGGRVAAFEILVGDRSIANLIREAKTFQIPNTIRLGRARGMQAMDDSLADLVSRGKITAEVALAHTESPDSLKKQLGIAAPAAAAPAAPRKAPHAGR